MKDKLTQENEKKKTNKKRRGKEDNIVPL